MSRTVIQVGLSSAESEKVQRAKAELLRGNDRSIALINGLLQLAHGARELRQREPVRLDVLTENAVKETIGEAVAHGPAVDVNVEPGVVVMGDELLLSQVIRDLLDTRHAATCQVARCPPR